MKSSSKTKLLAFVISFFVGIPLLAFAATKLVSPVAAPLASVNLGTAGNFVILTKSGVTTTGVTAIFGNMGVSPIAATAMTGFGLVLDKSGQFSASPKVVGKIYAASYKAPTPTVLTKAILDMQTAYTDAAGRKNPTKTELGVGNIGGMTFAPGLYKWSTPVTITKDITLSGDKNAVWIFQIAGTLDLGAGKNIILSGGAQAKNIFWQVSGKTSLEVYSMFQGNILDQTAIVLKTGAVLNGRALAQTAVTMDANTVENR